MTGVTLVGLITHILNVFVYLFNNCAKLTGKFSVNDEWNFFASTSSLFKLKSKLNVTLAID